MKKCKNCDQCKDLEEFPKDKKLLDGRGNWCKICSNKRSSVNNSKRIERRLLLGIELPQNKFKVCGICGVDKSFSEFNKNIRLQYGLEYCCRDCQNDSFRTKYRPKHREKSNLWAKQYRLNNKAKIKKYSANYYKLNKKTSNLKGKIWRNNNEGYIKERDRRYRQLNKALCNTHTQSRRAKKKNATHPDHNIAIEKIYQLMAIRVKKCIGIGFHVDHILPINRGGYHHHINLQVIPEKLNEGKGDNLDYYHPLLKHWTDLPDFLLDRIKLESPRELSQE